jgi:hypothetical protein
MGTIQAKIYDQEGKLQPFPMKNTPDNQHFAEYLRIHDRYTTSNQENKQK